MKNNYEIHQVPHGYSFILGFYGRCEDGSECLPYDMKLSEFRNAIDSVFQVDGNQSGTTFGWYKESLVGDNLNHFETLNCGHLYYFVVKPGTSKVTIPNLYITNNSANDNYDFDDTGRITNDCDYVPPTPTPKPNCCDGFSNSIITMGTQVGTENLNGIKSFGFEFGGMLCYDNLEITNLPSRYNFKNEDGSLMGYITTTGNFTNNLVNYTSRDGTCYHATIETTNGFNILVKG